MNRQQTDLFAFCVQIIDRLFNDITDRAHGDNDPVSVFGAVIIEQVIFATSQFADLAHIVFDNPGNRFVIRVGYLALLEVNIRVLRSAAYHRMIRVQRPAAEGIEGILIDQFRQVIIIHHFDFLRFMRSAESVKEVQERDASFDRSQMGYRSQIHDLLHAALGKQGKSGLPGCHYVLVVTENAQRVRGNGACANVEYSRQQFASHLVHVGDHQKQPLRSRKRSR